MCLKSIVFSLWIAATTVRKMLWLSQWSMVSHLSMQRLSYTPSLDSEPQKDTMTVLTGKLMKKKKQRIYWCLFGWGSSLSLMIMLLLFLNNYSSWPTWYQTTHYSRKSKSSHRGGKLFVPRYFLQRCHISNHILHYSLVFPKVIGEEEDIPYLNGVFL